MIMDCEQCVNCDGDIFHHPRETGLQPGAEERCECGTVNVVALVDSASGGFKTAIRAKASGGTRIKRANFTQLVVAICLFAAWHDEIAPYAGIEAVLAWGKDMERELEAMRHDLGCHGEQVRALCNCGAIDHAA